MRDSDTFLIRVRAKDVVMHLCRARSTHCHPLALGNGEVTDTKVGGAEVRTVELIRHHALEVGPVVESDRLACVLRLFVLESGHETTSQP